MATEIPYIKQNLKVSELLDVVGDETVYGERLKNLNDTEERINTKLKRYADFNDIETYLQLAKATETKAAQDKKDADQYAAMTRATADNYANDVTVATKREHEALNKRKEELDKQDAYLQGVDAGLKQREASLKERLDGVDAAQKLAEAKMKEATQIKTEYDEKMKKLAAAMG